MSTAELATSYAALILADDGVEITVRNDPREIWAQLRGSRSFEQRWKANIQFQADKIQTLIKAANVVDVEPIWASLFAKVRRPEMDEFAIGCGNRDGRGD
jgi:large subunit ribosomal protein LP1